MALIDRVDSWLNIFKRDTIKPASYDRLVRSRNLLAQDEISLKNVNDISKSDIQRYLSRLNDLGYAPNTIKKQFTLLTAYFKYAVSEGEMARPVYLGIRMPRTKYAQEHDSGIKVYTDDEQTRMMDELMTLRHPAYGALILMLETGMRVGEVLALRWEDIDWERRAVSISRTLVRLASDHGRTFVQRGAKSIASNRIIPLSQKAIELLQNMKPSEGFLFCTDDPETPLTYSCIVHHLSVVCDRAEVPYKGTHALRHTFATNCYHKGCDVKILSKLLGHADVKVTYNTYIHLYGDSLEEMRRVIDLDID